MVESIILISSGSARADKIALLIFWFSSIIFIHQFDRSFINVLDLYVINHYRLLELITYNGK